jgi:hypothetical protein
MLDKFSGIKELLAEMGITSSNEGRQGKPVPQSTSTSSEPDIDPDFLEEEDEAQWTVPVQPNVPKVEPVPAPAEAPALPDFIDPSWLPQEDPDAPRIKPGTFELPQFDIFDLPPRKSTPKLDLPGDEDIFGEPAKPRPAPSKPEQEPSATTPDDAQKFLARQNNDQVKEALSAFKRAMGDLKPKEKAKAIGVAMGKFKGLLTAATSIFSKDDIKRGMQSANALMEFLDSLINTLPLEIRELAGREMVKQVETTKERPPQPLTSKYLKNWRIKDMAFIRERARGIIQNTGLSRQEAEKLANDEWNTIVQLVDDYRPAGTTGWSEKQRRNAINLFTEEVSGGRDLQEAWNQIVKPFIDAGGKFDEKESTDEVVIKPDTSMYKKDELGNVGASLTEPDRLEADLDPIPEDARNDLVPYFVTLGEIANEFYSFVNNISGQPKGEVASVLKDLAEEAAKTAKEIVMKILGHKEWLQHEDVEFLFQEAWWVALTISEMAENYRIKVDESKGMVSWEDVKQGHFRIEADPTVSKVTESKDPNGRTRIRVRDRQVEDRARREAVRRMIESGSYDDYLQARRDYHAKKTELEKNTARELDRIRSYDYKMNKIMVNEWRSVLASSYSPQMVQQQFRRFKKIDELTALEIVKRARESWLDIGTIENLVYNTLRDRRVAHMEKAAREFEQEGLIEIKDGKIIPKSANPVATNLFVQYLSEKRNNDELSFARAVQETEGEKLTKFKPGQTRRIPGQRQLKTLQRQKVRARLKMFERLLKIAQDPDYAYVEMLLDQARVDTQQLIW